MGTALASPWLSFVFHEMTSTRFRTHEKSFKDLSIVLTVLPSPTKRMYITVYTFVHIRMHTFVFLPRWVYSCKRTTFHLQLDIDQLLRNRYNLKTAQQANPSVGT